jgi:hypothetical protein
VPESTDRQFGSLLRTSGEQHVNGTGNLTIALLGALETALYLAYLEAEADFPLRHELHRGLKITG